MNTAAPLARPDFATVLAELKRQSITGNDWAEAETLLNSDSLTDVDRRALRQAVRARDYNAMQAIVTRYRAQTPRIVLMQPPTARQWDKFTGVMWHLLQGLAALLFWIAAIPIALILFIAKFCVSFFRGAYRVYKYCGQALILIFTLCWAIIGYVCVWGVGFFVALLRELMDMAGKFLQFLHGEGNTRKEEQTRPPPVNGSSTCPENHTHFKCCDRPLQIEEFLNNTRVRELLKEREANLIYFQEQQQNRISALEERLEAQMKSAHQQDLMTYGLLLVVGAYGASKVFGAGRRALGNPAVNAGLAAARRATQISLERVSTWDGALEVAGEVVQAAVKRKALLSFLGATGIPYMFSFLNNATLFQA